MSLQIHYTVTLKNIYKAISSLRAVLGKCPTVSKGLVDRIYYGTYLYIMLS